MNQVSFTTESSNTPKSIMVLVSSYDHIVDTSISIFSRVSMLLSFVLAGYVSICVSRWDNIRLNMVGRMWGKILFER